MCLKRNEVERLDKEQTKVNEAAFDQDWIVYGPAGTGKTILALNRLRRLAQLRKNETHVFLSKSKMLGQWVSQSAEEMGVSELVKTYDKYVWDWLKEYIGGNPPTLKDKFGIDWDAALPKLRAAIKSKPDIKKRSIVLDEAQDIELGFFEACKLICSRVFILMDENQKTSLWANSKRSQIARILNVIKLISATLGSIIEIPLRSRIFLRSSTRGILTSWHHFLRRNFAASSKPNHPFGGCRTRAARDK